MSEVRETGDDAVLPFQVGDSAVRGRVVRLAGTIDDILTPHDYPDAVSELLGEAVCLVAMMGSALKFDGKLIFQAQGDGPVPMIVADYVAGGALRGMAKAAPDLPAEARGIAALTGKGHIAMTIDQGPDMERYQAVTPIEGEALSDAAVAYFDQSEQIPTVIRLAVGRIAEPGAGERWRAGGVMAQFVPGEGGARERGEDVIMGAFDREIWERSAAFVETVQADELLDPAISPERLLYRLFHEDGARVFDAQPVHHDCGCNSGKIAAVLERYGEEELRDMVEDGAITVTCEFCRKAYQFTPSGRPADAA